MLASHPDNLMTKEFSSSDSIIYQLSVTHEVFRSFKSKYIIPNGKNTPLQVKVQY